MNIRLQEHSSDCLLRHIEGEVKMVTKLVMSNQSCVTTRCVKGEQSWFGDLCYKDLSSNCLVIIIIYAKGIKIRVTHKSNVVIYSKLWTVSHRIVWIIKNFLLKLNTKLFLFYLKSTSSYLKRFSKIKT